MIRPLFKLPQEDSVLADHRDRVMYLLAYVVVIGITPFVVNDFIGHHFALASATTLTIATFVANGIAIHYKKPPPVPLAWMLLPVFAALGFAFAQHRLYAALWCYPILLFCFFVLPRQVATLTSAVILAVGTALLYDGFGPAMAVRFAASLGVNIVVIRIIIDVMRDLQKGCWIRL